ncbi:MAG: DUF547 domain-containing protein [Planctomycetota bacterium]
MGRLWDAWDVLKHLRSPLEAAKLALPARALKVHVLNPEPPRGASPDASAAAQALKRIKNELALAALVDGRVDYAGLRGSPLLAELERAASHLHAVRLSDLPSDAERIAFWLNVYNVLAIHGVIARGITRSVMQIPTFFATTAYRVGDQRFTLDEVENGVLRRNQAGPKGGLPFAPDDPRLAWSPSAVDPRIHMALVCASASCPPVAFFSPEGLDSELARATQGFLDAEVRVTPAAVELPLVFRYYPADFGDVRAFLEQHGSPRLREALAAAPDARWTYRRYDWSLNQV